MKREFHITVTSDDTHIVDLLAKASAFSKQHIKKIMQQGAVWLEDNLGVHRVRRADKTANTGHIVHCYYHDDVFKQIPPEPSLIADEQDYSVWHKPSGMLSQGSKWGDHCAIHRWIEQHYTFADGTQRPCFIVHRLDKAASGLIIIAHKKKLAKAIAALFEERTIDKHYYAKVGGEFPIKFNQHLDQEPEPKPILIESHIDGKLSKTFVQRIDYNAEKNQSLLDIKIATGRKHQIRIHLSRYGYPIIGDRLYGIENDSIDLQLLSYKLQFVSPVDNTNKVYINPNRLDKNDY